LIQPTQQQYEEVECAGTHVGGAEVLVPGQPLELLLTHDSVEVEHLRVVVRVAVFLAKLADVCLEMQLFNWFHGR